MREVAVIDYGAGNIASLINSLEYSLDTCEVFNTDY